MLYTMLNSEGKVAVPFLFTVFLRNLQEQVAHFS